MSGETDLDVLLASIEVTQRDGLYCFVVGRDDLLASAEASVREAEGLSLVVSLDRAREAGFEPDYVAAWLTLAVHSSLAAVGLTAAVSRVLADQDISCNVIAGFHHDHLLVPADRAADAIGAIRALAG